MNNYIAIIFLLLPCSVFAEKVDCENPLTTYEMNICSKRDVEDANSVLELYLAKAIERISEDIKKSGEDNSGIQLLKKSQIAWLEYRSTYCSAIYEMWSGGTIRGVMSNSCMLNLTKQRTLVLWSDYLTYMDSTTPILPRPE